MRLTHSEALHAAIPALEAAGSTIEAEATQAQPTLVIVRGKGTPHEQRIQTTILVVWCARAQQWMTIPPKTNT